MVSVCIECCFLTAQWTFLHILLRWEGKSSEWALGSIKSVESIPLKIAGTNNDFQSAIKKQITDMRCPRVTELYDIFAELMTLNCMGDF